MTSTEPISVRLRDHVADRASKLQTDYRQDRSAAVADLARLRRGIGQQPGEDIALIGLTIAGLYSDPRGLRDGATDAERAAFAALTLFALHQQSHRNASMHRKGYSFGRSARLLGRHTQAQDAVRARFSAVATATSWDEGVRHARGLIQQFRAHDIPLDYGQFAVDLYRLLHRDFADSVRLAWGRDFYRVRNAEDDGEPAVSSDSDNSED